ncbi:MAG: multicopper oxidase domain-containing protein [Flavobacteriales bacterium]|nr:multicopper oxidase domain-containing protein [Flavobacteriales bacterium]
MLHKAFVCILTLHLFGWSHAAVVYDTVYINKGLITMVDGSNHDYYSFNATTTFETTNKRIEIGLGDSLYLAIVNTDAVVHGFDVTNTSSYSTNIPATDTVEVPMKFEDLGVYIFYDNANYPNFRYLGLGGMIVVDDFSGTQFYWNIKDHEGDWNDSLDAGWTVDWNDYYPDYFTINGYSNPLINDDPDARIVGSVGETMRIYISNTGEGIHSLHFHGYHLNILYSSKYPNHVGRSKDTFPIESMETLILELVPDKVGEYPVHDHNLVAVSGGNIYPNGMFLTMLIE